jgi:hypothetical protein
LPAIGAPAAAAALATVVALVRRRDTARVFAAASLATFAILLAYYGQQDAWGYRSPQITASFLRYLLPGFAVMTVFAAGAVVALTARWGWPAYILPAAFIAGSAWYVHVGPGGVIETHGVVAEARTLRSQVIANTEPDAVIAVRIMDKVLFPHRQTMTLTYAIQNEEPFPKNGLETWDYVPGPARFAEVAATVHDAGIPFYVLAGYRFEDMAPYQYALVARGLYLREVHEVEAGDTPFFKVSRVGASR